jgi:4a-hydroxytetrahydrobiopterin dehydratase
VDAALGLPSTQAECYEGHYPDVSFGWGRAIVSLSTKKIKGLHENDFIMASKIDRVLDRSGRSLDR